MTTATTTTEASPKSFKNREGLRASAIQELLQHPEQTSSEPLAAAIEGPHQAVDNATTAPASVLPLIEEMRAAWRELEASDDRTDEDGYERAYAAYQGWLSRAEALPTNSLDAAIVKAFALSWLMWIDLWQADRMRSDYTTDGRLALDIQAFMVAPQEPAPASLRPDRDWQEWACHHPGMVPFPAHKPVCLLALDHAIPQEAGRLLALAEAEIERRRQAYAGHPDPTLWPRVEHDLRRDMRTEALERAAAQTDPAASSFCDDALFAALDAHRQASGALYESVNPSDEEWVRQNGGDASEEAMAPAVAINTKASLADDQAWRDVIATRPRTLTGLLCLLRHIAQRHDSYRGMSEEPDFFEALIASVEGLRLAEVCSARHDLSSLTIRQLAQLVDVLNRHCESLADASDRAFLWRADTGLDPVGVILDDERERAAMFHDAAVAEIRRRSPDNAEERGQQLRALIRNDLRFGQRIEPKLMEQFATAWVA